MYPPYWVSSKEGTFQEAAPSLTLSTGKSTADFGDDLDQSSFLVVNDLIRSVHMKFPPFFDERRCHMWTAESGFGPY